MHNRKKPVAPPTEAEVKALREKSFMYKSLVDMVLARKRSMDKSQETLDLVGKLLRLNPDFYSLWNMRREILCENNPALSGAVLADKLDLPDVREVELQISADGIRRNPKCYGAWHHRLWVADRMVMDFDAELQLCKEFLRQDQRNFHCWNYRRAIHQRSGRSSGQEFVYSTEKIQENFSNYSAFHHRSTFLNDAEMGLEDLLESECSVVENAIFTEPDDQSAWWYQQFLFTWAWARYHEAGLPFTSYLAALEKQCEIVTSLLELEPESRWAMNSLLFLFEQKEKLRAIHPTLSFACDAEESCRRRKELIAQLITIDPMHKNRYLYIAAKLE